MSYIPSLNSFYSKKTNTVTILNSKFIRIKKRFCNKIKVKSKWNEELIMDMENKKFHFIAIGGIGMSGLAKYLLELGCSVSGSDIKDSKYIKQLEKLGAKITIGHSAENIQPDMIVVASTAIRETNPEKIRAKELGLKIYHRSDILKMISEGLGRDKKQKFLGFSGTHGKTTTSGLCTYVLEKAGLRPSYCVGGIIPDLNTNAKASDGDFFVAELDESDGTIVKYSPYISVINNLEIDHVDFYKDGFQELLDTFKTHLSHIEKSGKVIVNNDCNGIKKLMEQNPEYRFITFGLTNADYMAVDIEYHEFGSQFSLKKNGEILGKLKLTIPGRHNVYNTVAVCAALLESGIDFSIIQPHFEHFSGMGRRFQLVAEFNGIKIIDDYAHHPSEIKTTLESAKNAADGKLVAIFQPHRYSRLKGLWNNFLKSFDSVDKLYVVDVYAASEDPIDGINSEKFVQALNSINAKYIPGTIDEAAKKIAPELEKGDFVITLGAGDITKIGKAIEAARKAGV